LFKEKFIYCPKCGAKLALEIDGKHERIVHVKGSKTEVMIGTYKTILICNSKRADTKHKEICGQRVEIENGK
jgi:hypothetical protein